MPDLDSDARNSAQAYSTEVSTSEGDEYSTIVAQFEIEESTWNGIRNGLKSDMKDFLDWIDDKVR